MCLGVKCSCFQIWHVTYVLNSTCCMDDCPACIAANAPVSPDGFPGAIESSGFVGSMGGHLETLVSPIPLLNKAFKPLLVLVFSLFGRNGRLDICFEVVVEMFDAFVVKADDF